MSMYDRCYCATKCERKNCERNINFNKPCTRVYTVSEFDTDAENTRHIRCKYFSPIGEEYDDE